MHSENIQKALLFLKKTFGESEWLAQNPKEYAYRYDHTLRVSHVAHRIALAESLDADVAVVGALLHDISYAKPLTTPEEQRNHGRLSAEMVEVFLETLDLTEKQREQILLGIAMHVDDDAGRFAGAPSIEAKTIGDSDNIDRFDAYRLLEHFEYHQFLGKTAVKQQTLLQDWLQKQDSLLSYMSEFCTRTAQHLWQEKLALRQDFYEKLLAQLTAGIDFERRVLSEKENGHES